MDDSSRSFAKHRSASNQKARRRRKTLFRKLSEYSAECAADIHLSIRMKNSGQIYTLATILEGWPLSQDQLVSLMFAYLLVLNPVKCTHCLFWRNYNTPSPSRRVCQTQPYETVKSGIVSVTKGDSMANGGISCCKSRMHGTYVLSISLTGISLKALLKVAVSGLFHSWYFINLHNRALLSCLSSSLYILCKLDWLLNRPSAIICIKPEFNFSKPCYM